LHQEAKEALVLSIAGVTAIMLFESLILLILLDCFRCSENRARPRPTEEE
jgi:hypothetical protein